jgi:uncharacterized protein (TIGR04222 family)
MNTTIVAQPDVLGVGSNAFLAVYLLLCAVGVAGALRCRWRILTTRPSRDPTDDLDPYLVAYLGGGRHLALLAALSSLYVGGHVVTHGHKCQRLEPCPAERRASVEEAVLAETERPASRLELSRSPSVCEATADLRAELVRRGLLLTDKQRGSVRRWTYGLVGLLGLGCARVAAELSADRFNPALALTVLVLAAVVCWWGWQARRLSSPGRRELVRLRATHEHLSPAMSPAWPANGADAAAIGVALFGAAAVWTSAPGFANELLLARGTVGAGAYPLIGNVSPLTGSGGGGGCGGGGGGGCGAGGGSCGSGGGGSS